MRYIEGVSRDQTALFPESLEDFVPINHPVRVIDAFVSQLDFGLLGFSKSETKQTGRKPYHPGDLLKLYLYGYYNQIRSSRQLERECHRNLELLWLVKRLAPDFKTIADFRKENETGIRLACQSFIGFCKELRLIGGRVVAIDGSKFKAAASRDQVVTVKGLEEEQKRIDRSIERYLERIEEADREEALVPDIDKEQVGKALEELKRRKAQNQGLVNKLIDAGQNQYCKTDPEAKLMRSGRDGKILAYNLQTAVDAKARLIVHHEVIAEGCDNLQLAPVAKATQEVLEAKHLTILADAGYSNGEQLAECEAFGVEAIVPPNRAINNQGDYFQKEVFYYEAKQDHYRCPAGEVLHYKTYSSESKLKLYTTEACAGCYLKSQCTKAKQRWISRHFNEEAFAKVEQRLLANPHAMRERASIVEAPFGSIKRMMGNGRFLCRGLKATKTEMALSVLAYNFKRVINIVGVQGLMTQLA